MPRGCGTDQEFAVAVISGAGQLCHLVVCLGGNKVPGSGHGCVAACAWLRGVDALNLFRDRSSNRPWLGEQSTAAGRLATHLAYAPAGCHWMPSAVPSIHGWRQFGWRRSFVGPNAAASHVRDGRIALPAVCEP